MRHLQTENVSPQYHCVFDDLFETVFASAPNKEVLFEAISNLLWENNRELYAEDEFDNGGNLIYTPPPLDNVWLTEPERRDRNARLKEQRIRRVKKEHELEQRMHEPAVPIVDTIPDDLPSLGDAFKDDDSSDDSNSVEDHSGSPITLNSVGNLRALVPITVPYMHFGSSPF